MVPLVSYIMASYNHEKFVTAMIRSILEQTVRECELVVIDDGSTDRTPDILREFAAQDGRMRVIVQENQGVVAARNRGLAEARGEYLSIVDSDDLLPLDRTARLLEAMEERDVVMAYGDCWIINARGERSGTFWDQHPVVPGPISEKLFAHYCFVPAAGVLVRREIVEATGGFWGSGPTCDYVKWIEVGLKGEVRRLAGEPVGCWRHHGANVSQEDGGRRAQGYELLIYDLEQIVQRHPLLRADIGDDIVSSRFAKCYLQSGFHYGLAQDWINARRVFQLAALKRPSFLALAALVSTFPGLRSMAGPLYRAYSRYRQ